MSAPTFTKNARGVSRIDNRTGSSAATLANDDNALALDNLALKDTTAWRQVVILAADFTTASGAFVNVDNGGGDALKFDIGVSEVWTFEAHLNIGSASASGERMTIQGSQTPTAFMATMVGNTTVGVTTLAINAYGTTSATMNTQNAQTGQFHAWGSIRNTSIADSVYFQIVSLGAQNCTVKAGSFLIARRVS